eukprot:10123231-Karenia_brevis.AAC.1
MDCRATCPSEGVGRQAEINEQQSLGKACTDMEAQWLEVKRTPNYEMVINCCRFARTFSNAATCGHVDALG